MSSHTNTHTLCLYLLKPATSFTYFGIICCDLTDAVSPISSPVGLFPESGWLAMYHSGGLLLHGAVRVT